MKYKEPPESGDPSGLAQDLQDLRINIQCCRYWWLKKWKHRRLSYPFWRLYYNVNPGAFVYYRKKVQLHPGEMILIPPFTPFSTNLDFAGDKEEYGLDGGWINSRETEIKAIDNGYVLHLFLHFNLGYPLDLVVPGIYPLEINDAIHEVLQQIIRIHKSENQHFSLKDTIRHHLLINFALSQLPASVWENQRPDHRIQEAIRFMNRNLHQKMTNKDLADSVGMAVNSFAKLFRQQMGNSPGQYLMRLRVENACNLLHHTQSGISQIAEECGFTDRYYFTKAFKKMMHLTPVKYRNQFLLPRQ